MSMREGKLFINYRRDDSRADSGRLYDRLAARFPGKVFRDVASIEPGIEWADAIVRVLSQSDACLVVIGKNWLDIADAAGNRRLDDPRDTVRQEIAAVLKRKIRVFPVLVGGARMPAEEDLPADLQPLCRRNAIELNEQYWDEGVRKLITALETQPDQPLEADAAKPPLFRRAWVLVASGALVAAIALAVYFGSRNTARVGGSSFWAKCRVGFVWRQADATDHVCVTPQTRNKTAADNAALGRKNANGTCVQGFVWREADSTDHVCVTPQTRAQTAADNSIAATRALPPMP
jgi:hypothetical protein